jgi:tripartite-type tricarboxylate transporter receptor subunit TctC
MKMPYKPMDDLTYLGQFVSSPMPVILRSGSKWKSFEEMMSFAKSNPGKLRWSTAGQKGGPHMAMLAAFKKEGASTTYVPFKGGAKALAALLGKTIDMAVISDFAAPLAAGTIKIIAESTPDRNPSALNAKTLAELGYPLSPAIFFGLAGPNGLSQDVINKWDDALGKIMKSSKFVGLLKKLKATPKYANSADFTKSVRADYTAAGKVLAGVKF